MPEEEKTALKEQYKKTAEKQPVLRRFGHWYTHRKRYSIPLTILVVITIVLAVPATRYALAGPFWHESVEVTVVDSQTGAPVSQAAVTLDGQQSLSDKDGKATVKDVAAGFHTVTIKKANYKDAQLRVEAPLFTKKTAHPVKLQATGRVVSVVLTDSITGKPVADALVDGGGNNTAKSDADGKASLVIPPSDSSIDLAITGEGYNQAKATVTPDKEGHAVLTPRGQVFFLSKRTGKIDVVRTNLDGSDRTTIVKGTGTEQDNGTSLLASRDWRYLALLSRRTAGHPATLFLIDTKTSKINEVDGGDNASLSLIGWSGHHFWYSVDRDNKQYWAAKRTALKTLDADTGQIQTVDENDGFGSDEYDAWYQTMDNFYITKQGVIYSKVWTSALGSYDDTYGSTRKRLSSERSAIMLASSDGSNKSTVESYAVDGVAGINARLYKPEEVYFQFYNPKDDKTTYLEYEDGRLQTAPGDTEDEFGEAYPTYLLSPSGKQTFWAESRDGKNTIFVGDDEGDNEKQLASASKYTPYGWMTDKFLLLQKDDSELYITTPDQLKSGAKPVKISDYHKPNFNYAGYGYGYGGL